jgi:hypothetical protein
MTVISSAAGVIGRAGDYLTAKKTEGATKGVKPLLADKKRGATAPLCKTLVVVF